MQSYEEKLVAIDLIQKTGLIGEARISSLRATCPFCGTPAALVLALHVRGKAADYSCIACSEAGLVNDLAKNVKDAKRPARNFRIEKSQTVGQEH